MPTGSHKYLKGDPYLWAGIGVLALFSFLPVYSASTNLTMDYGTSTVFFYMLKHILSRFIGLIILVVIQFIDYKYFVSFSVIAMPIIFLLLIITLIQGPAEDISNTARWLHVIGNKLSFQTSTISGITLLIYCTRYLDQKKDHFINWMESFFPLIFPTVVTIMLILPSNGSTAVILCIWVVLLLFVGGYPLKYIFTILLIGMISIVVLIFLSFYWNKKLPSHRIHTWKHRIKNFYHVDEETHYQILRAKTAIVLGGKLGHGPGKSALKIFLPQSSSDFIYAIIIEEYGVTGGLTLLLVYILILSRIIIIATHVQNYLGTLLVLSVGLPIIGQALINMGVSVHVIPVTGQTLPLISAGSTSIWITCLSFGMILSVSRHTHTS